MIGSREAARDAGGAALALTAVLAIHGLLPALAALLGLVGPALDVSPGAVDRAAPREAVLWSPPPPAAPAAPEGAVPAPAEPSPAAPPTSAPALADDASPALVEAAPAPATPERRRKRSRLRALARYTGPDAPAVAEVEPPPPRALTPKEQRELAREERREERRAERKQCAELTDQIVQVEEDEWWFGRELVNCYRTHLEQFDLIGGASWAEDEKGKKIGVKLYVSKGERGEPGRLAGFKSGDVLVKVNGVKVAGWAGAALLGPQLLRSHAKVERVRKGETQVVHLRVKDPDELDRARDALADAAAHRVDPNPPR